jgi:hypothetical protein
VKQGILRFWGRRWRLLLVIAALLAVFIWGMAAGQALTLRNLTPKPTPTPTIPTLPALGDVAPLLPGAAWQTEG